MNRMPRERCIPRRRLAILATFGLVASALVAAAPSSFGVVNTCRARNVTQGTPSASDLQRVINAASSGDVIAIKYVCVGSFKIDKKLSLVGRATPGMHKAVLHANDLGRVLLVKAAVRLTNLKITGGGGLPSGGMGGGIANIGPRLTLVNTVVSGNAAAGAGGIYNSYGGTLTLAGTSSVRANTATSFEGGGITNLETLTLMGSSSVSGNTAVLAGGGIYNTGTLTLKNSSSVTGNTSDAEFGGIYFDAFACDSGGAAEWTGAISPNTPDDTTAVTYITCT